MTAQNISRSAKAFQMIDGLLPELERIYLDLHANP
jgi:hypothetical protein